MSNNKKKSVIEEFWTDSDSILVRREVSVPPLSEGRLVESRGERSIVILVLLAAGGLASLALAIYTIAAYLGGVL